MCSSRRILLVRVDDDESGFGGRDRTIELTFDASQFSGLFGKTGGRNYPTPEKRRKPRLTECSPCGWNVPTLPAAMACVVPKNEGAHTIDVVCTHLSSYF